jgi:hypothetical protein
VRVESDRRGVLHEDRYSVVLLAGQALGGDQIKEDANGRLS